MFVIELLFIIFGGVIASLITLVIFYKIYLLMKVKRNRRFLLPLSLTLPIYVYKRHELSVDNFTLHTLNIIVGFICSFIFLINFEIFSNLIYKKPLYFEDLEHKKINIDEVPISTIDTFVFIKDDDIPIAKRKVVKLTEAKKYQQLFTNIQHFTLSVSFALMFDFIYFSYFNLSNPVDILIAIGSLTGLYYRIVRYIGKVVIMILNKKKQAEELQELSRIAIHRV